jgi:hypothetical protein
LQSDELIRLDVETLIGPLACWTRPEPEDSDRPVLLAIASSFMNLRALDRMPGLLADACQVVLAELPSSSIPMVPDLSAWRVAAAFSQLIGSAFRGRPVVALGFGDAALIAVSIRTPEVVRVVALDPPVRSEKAWPLRSALEARLAAASPALKRFLADIHGVGEAAAPRDHRRMFQTSQAPVDMLVGEAPLMPERPTDRLPSLVDEEDRAWLRTNAPVDLRVVSGAGHDLARDAGGMVLAAARSAVERAAAFRRPMAQIVVRLADATPWTARRVLYLGPEPDAFRSAFLARNPAAAVDAVATPGAYDALVLVEPNPALASALADVLAPGGCLLVATQLGQAGRLAAEALTGAGLTLDRGDRVITPVGTVLLRARKAPARPIPLTTVVYARALMDIRTELPARGLRTCPDLEVEYQWPPFAQSVGGAPGVVVLTRPAEWTVEAWRATAARAMLARQVLVIEYDDHPELVYQMTRGAGLAAEDWERFRVVHAIQTTTEPLLELFRRHNPEVALFPNAVFSLAPFPAGRRAPRVFYGGVSRGPFAVEVARALAPAVAASPSAVFHVVGDRAFFEALPTEAKVYDDFLSYEAYLDAMAACSVSLSPLSDSPMVETKSDAKYLDASRAGVVTLASPTVYQRTIQSGRNGLIAATLDDWGAMLTRLLADDAERERLARAAWQDVRDRRMFAAQVDARRDWYGDLLARREAIDAAILRRAPEVARHLPSGALRAGAVLRTT